MIDLRSDTVTLPPQKMKEFMFQAPIGDDVYGEDPSINELQEYASALFGKESALFVPSGTMANLVSVLSHCSRGDEVILGNKSHIFVYEAGGISAYGGIHSHQLNNNEDGTIDNQTLHNTLISNKAALFLWNTESQIDLPAQDLGAAETVPEWHTNGQTGDFDAALEEVWHVVTHSGYSKAYPTVFGENSGI